MEFDLDYKLQQFREEQPELFDKNGKRYTGTPLSNRTAEMMLELINELADLSNWSSLNDGLPEDLEENETVWACNKETGFVALACLVYCEDGWLWAISNGVIYSENGKIISECDIDDAYDFTHYQRLLKLPK